MPQYDFKRLNRLMMIYRTVQTVLIAILIYMAFNFQQLFASKGRPDQFITSFVVAIVVQLILFYPIYKLSQRDVSIETDGSAVGITVETLAALRKKRLLGDLWKFCVIAFFITFVALAPDAKKAAGAPLILAATIFSFLLACLTYFQCFNRNAKRQINSV